MQQLKTNTDAILRSNDADQLQSIKLEEYEQKLQEIMEGLTAEITKDEDIDGLYQAIELSIDNQKKRSSDEAVLNRNRITIEALFNKKEAIDVDSTVLIDEWLTISNKDIVKILMNKVFDENDNVRAEYKDSTFKKFLHIDETDAKAIYPALFVGVSGDAKALLKKNKEILEKLKIRRAALKKVKAGNTEV